METEATLSGAAVDDITANRIARAKRYLDEDLQDQRGWYSMKAARYKRWSQGLAVTVLAAGVLILFVQIVPAVFWVKIYTAALGLIVVLAKVAERIYHFNAAWIGYREASELMKREYRLYINGAIPYRQAGDEDRAYLQFVEAIEGIIAKEQQLYPQSRAGGARRTGGDAEGGAPGGGAR
jgi:Protein of unknown function (DUF4231)